MKFDQDNINLYRDETVYKLINGKDPEPGSNVKGEEFIPLLNSEIRKREHRWKDHKDEVEVLSPKKAKESPSSSKGSNRS